MLPVSETRRRFSFIDLHSFIRDSYIRPHVWICIDMNKWNCISVTLARILYSAIDATHIYGHNAYALNVCEYRWSLSNKLLIPDVCVLLKCISSDTIDVWCKSKLGIFRRDVFFDVDHFFFFLFFSRFDLHVFFLDRSSLYALQASCWKYSSCIIHARSRV